MKFKELSKARKLLELKGPKAASVESFKYHTRFGKFTEALEALSKRTQTPSQNEADNHQEKKTSEEIQRKHHLLVLEDAEEEEEEDADVEEEEYDMHGFSLKSLAPPLQAMFMYPLKTSTTKCFLPQNLPNAFLAKEKSSAANINSISSEAAHAHTQKVVSKYISEDDEASNLIGNKQTRAERRLKDGFEALFGSISPEESLYDFLEPEDFFDTWKNHLDFGFGVLLYGLGSKVLLLQEFCQSHLRDGVVCEMFGFRRDFNLKILLGGLLKKFDKSLYDAESDGIDSICKKLVRAIQRRKLPVYLVIHSLGCLTLSLQSQKALGMLLDLQQVQVICSADHMRLESLWEPAFFERLNLVYEKVCTPLDYRLETLSVWTKESPPDWLAYECVEMQFSHLRLDLILPSLTTNHKRLLKVIATALLREVKVTGITEDKIMADAQVSGMGFSSTKVHRLLEELFALQVLRRSSVGRGRDPLHYIPATRDQLEFLSAGVAK